MKKYIIIILTIVHTANLSANQNFKLKVSSLEIRKTSSNNYTARFFVKYRDLHKEYFTDTTVPIPVEDLIIEGEFSNYTIKERDFLFAGINLDINGDKDLDDSYTIIFNSNKYFLNKYELGISSGKKNTMYHVFYYFNQDNKPLINQYDETGKPFIVYSLDYRSRKMMIGVNKGEQPVEIKEFPNPNIQILLIKPVNSLNKKINFSIGSGINYKSFSNEKIIPGNDDSWNGISWVVKEMEINKKQKVEFKVNLNNISPPFALYVVPNLSLEKGMRIRMKPGFSILNIK